LTTKRTRTTRLLRSSPITGPSPLLQGGPPRCPASVLSPSQFQLLGVLLYASRVNTRPDPSGRAVPAFRTSAKADLAPPLRRTTTWPARQAPARLVPGQQLDPGFGRRPYCFDVSSVVHSRSPSRLTPDTSRAPFPQRSPPRLIHRSSLRWFAISPCVGDRGGPTSITGAAPHRSFRLLHRNLLQRSRHTVIAVPLERDRRELPGQPHIERVMQIQIRQNW
jgi:hypothetical protein